MKKLLPFLCLLLASCSSTPSLQDNVEKAQKESMKDPASYELISLDKFKEITYGDEIQSRIDQQITRKESAERQLDFYTNSVQKEDEVNKAKADIERADKIISGLEELKVKKSDSLNVVAATIYKHKFNGKNGLGIVVPSLNFAIVLPDGSIKGFSNDEKSLPNNPNDFKEYFDLLK